MLDNDSLNSLRPDNYIDDKNVSYFYAEYKSYYENDTSNGTANGSTFSAESEEVSSPDKVYWALLLLPLPLVAVFGNILVILSVYKERSLQTVTNYFIVSLAFADLLVAAVVMPFALYVLVNVNWELSDTLCDFYIALDVTCSTASIFNLVAISIDRFIAVTQPIKYSKHKNNKRVFLTIAIVWLVSAAIGSPIVLGLNTSPERIPQLCVFYNSDFIIYSSLSSFYIPCLVMIFLYYRIFKAIHERAKKSAKRLAAPKCVSSGMVIENKAQTRKLMDNRHVDSGGRLQVIVDTEAVTTNTGSGSPPEDDEEEDTGGDENNTSSMPNDESCHIVQNRYDEGCHIIQNRQALATCPESSTLLINALTSDSIRVEIPVNENVDSGYGPSNIEQETQFCVQNTFAESPIAKRTLCKEISVKKNGVAKGTGRGEMCGDSEPTKKKPRFNLGRRHKSSRKKREKASAKRERKATKTLAIVLGMFLACWVPFFTCNILDAICIKLENDRFRPGMSAFLMTTWLGYINSCFNPVIYTIFNMEFRKAFKKLLADFWLCFSHSNR